MGTFVKFFVVDLLTGVYDSCRGLFSFWGLDNIPATLETSSPFEAPQRRLMTTLEKRRLEASQERQQRKRSVSGQDFGHKAGARVRLVQCCGLNVVILLFFHFMVVPLVDKLAELIVMKGGFSEYRRLIDFLKFFWVMPSFFISRIVNAIWFQDIANAAARKFHTAAEIGLDRSISQIIADFLMSILLETIFLLQTFLVGCLPIAPVAQLLSIIHWCLIYALYAFEYMWMKSGYGLHHRLQMIESELPYFIGYGAILAFVTLYPSSVVISGCFFGALFPLFIVSSYSASQMGRLKRRREGYEWPPIRVFLPSIVVCNWLSNRLFSLRKSPIRKKVTLSSSTK